MLAWEVMRQHRLKEIASQTAGQLSVTVHEETACQKKSNKEGQSICWGQITFVITVLSPAKQCKAKAKHVNTCIFLHLPSAFSLLFTYDYKTFKHIFWFFHYFSPQHCTFSLMSRVCLSSSFRSSSLVSLSTSSMECFHSICSTLWGSWDTYWPIFTLRRVCQ